MSYNIQPTSNTCGPTCLKIILKYYGINVDEYDLIKICMLQENGWSVLQLTEVAYKMGLKATIQECKVMDISSQGCPAIILARKHFIVLSKLNDKYAQIIDPSYGKLKLSIDDFTTKFSNIGEITIIYFRKLTSFKSLGTQAGETLLFKRFLTLLTPYKSGILKLITLTTIVSSSQMILPFITRAIIDIGIVDTDWDFVKILFFAYIMLISATILGGYIQASIVSQISNQVRLHMLEDYMSKILD